jgi:sugar phosphate isomerase/epimerase
MNVGLCTISRKDADPTEPIELAATAGYDGVEIWGRDHVADGGTERCERIRSAAANVGIEIPVYGSYLRPGTEGFPEELDHELTVATRLDADLVRVWAGDVEHGDHTEDEWTAVREDLQTATDAAAERGLAITVEKHGGTLTNTREGARRLVESIDGPCGLNWQPLFELSPEDIVAEAEALAPLVNNVHLQAVPERGSRDRCALVDGYFDVARCVEALTHSGFEGYFELEFVTDGRPYREAIEADLDFLRTVS